MPTQCELTDGSTCSAGWKQISFYPDSDFLPNMSLLIESDNNSYMNQMRNRHTNPTLQQSCPTQIIILVATFTKIHIIITMQVHSVSVQHQLTL